MTEAKTPSRDQRALAKRLFLAREKRGLTQAELGEKAGLSPAYAAHIENCLIVSPGSDSLRRLAKALNVPLEWLAFGIGEEPNWEVAA